MKDALIRNDAYMNSVVSEDFKTLTILAEVRDASDEDKKEGRVGFTYVSDRINEAVDPERDDSVTRSEEHTSELQSRSDLVCRLLLEKKKKKKEKKKKKKRN